MKTIFMCHDRVRVHILYELHCVCVYSYDTCIPLYSLDVARQIKVEGNKEWKNSGHFIFIEWCVTKWKL